VSHRISVLSLSVLGVAALVSCRPSPNPQSGTSTAPPSPPLLVVAVDRSGSTEATRLEHLERLRGLTDVAAGSSRPLSVWSFDRKPVCIWGPAVPDDENALLEVMKKELLPDPTITRKMTRPALLLDVLQADAAVKKSSHTDVVILTDGDSEVADDTPLFKKSAHALHQCPSIRLFVLGVRPEARSFWQSAFQAEWGERFHLTGPSASEMQTALNLIH
jgi:hypothetical protein